MKIDARLKLLYLIIAIFIIFFCSSIFDYILSFLIVFTLIIGLRINIKIFIKFIKFGIFLSIFVLIFNLFVHSVIQLAFKNAIETIVMYSLIILYSIVYKEKSSIREISYAVAWYLKPLMIFGYNPKKMYTLLMLTLNQVMVISKDVDIMYKHDNLKRKYISKKEKVVQIIDLISPFIFKSLHKNEIITISLMNKGYDINDKSLNVTFAKTNKNAIFIMIIFIVQVILMRSFR